MSFLSLAKYYALYSDNYKTWSVLCIVRLRERKQLGSICAAITILPQGQDQAFISWSIQENLFGTVYKY